MLPLALLRQRYCVVGTGIPDSTLAQSPCGGRVAPSPPSSSKVPSSSSLLVLPFLTFAAWLAFLGTVTRRIGAPSVSEAEGPTSSARPHSTFKRRFAGRCSLGCGVTVEHEAARTTRRQTDRDCFLGARGRSIPAPLKHLAARAAVPPEKLCRRDHIRFRCAAAQRQLTLSTQAPTDPALARRWPPRQPPAPVLSGTPLQLSLRSATNHPPMTPRPCRPPATSLARRSWPSS